MTTNPLPELNTSDLELLSAYLDRQLPDDARTVLEARLGREPALRGALEELRTTVAMLRALEPIRPPRSFTIDPATVQRPSSVWWRSFTLPFAGLTTVLLVAVVLVGLLRVGNSSNSVSVASAPTANMAQLNAPTDDQSSQAVAEPTAARLAPAAAAPMAPAPAATAPAAPITAPAATTNPAAAAGAAESVVATTVPTDARIAGTTSDNSAIGATALPIPAPSADDTVPPLTTPASSSPGTTTLAPVPAVPAAPQTRPAILPIVLILVFLIGAAIAGAVWMRRRKQ